MRRKIGKKKRNGKRKIGKKKRNGKRWISLNRHMFQFIWLGYLYYVVVF